MYSGSRRIVEMAIEAEHRPRHLDFFCQHTPIHRRISKLPATMSKPNSTLWHPLHRLAMYIFRFHPQIP